MAILLVSHTTPQRTRSPGQCRQDNLGTSSLAPDCWTGSCPLVRLVCGVCPIRSQRSQRAGRGSFVAQAVPLEPEAEHGEK